MLCLLKQKAIYRYLRHDKLKKENHYEKVLTPWLNKLINTAGFILQTLEVVIIIATMALKFLIFRNILVTHSLL